jgi:hypothetical protein
VSTSTVMGAVIAVLMVQVPTWEFRTDSGERHPHHGEPRGWR